MALVCDSLVCIAMPKTGSLWLRTRLLELRESAVAVEGSRHLIDGARDWERPVITVVRHVIPWVESVWRWLYRPDSRQRWLYFPGPSKCFSELPHRSFAEWITSIIEHDGMIGRCFSQYTTAADHVLHNERLREDCKSLLPKLMLGPRDWSTLDAPWVNVSKTSIPCEWPKGGMAALCERETEYLDRWYGGA